MKILVTGAAGFIGSFTCRKLIKHSHDVVGIDNFDPFYSIKAKKFNIDLINLYAKKQTSYFDLKEVQNILNLLHRKRGEGTYKFYNLDILHQDKLENLFSENDFDAVIHLAAMAGVPHSIKLPIKYTNVNIKGTQNLLELCVKYSIKNIIFASSSSVYGNCEEVPFKEELDVDFPISPYAATKRMGEILNYTYHHLYNLNISNLRFFTVYGPLQRPYGMAIQKFIKQTYNKQKMTIYGDGSMSRDYTYIEDITDGILKAIQKNKGYKIFNLGNNSSIDLIKLTDLIKENMGAGSITNVKAPPTEVPITYADIRKANKVLGYDPKTKIEEGIQKQIEIFLAMPKWYKKLHLK
ncbi:NAD-dependent epimerase/dehydratase family protein [Candidatus Dojkabacteria bacterium]|nr:NAD-dependent epimerase/dehydratase family protein [Candidatus Dojkabacteria bacterium]